jgi:hypothetical protein
MRHPSAAALIDIVENAPGSPRVAERQHLESCRSCQAQVASLRAALADARSDDAAEPSPLFWDHFAARIADAIHDEPPPVEQRARFGWVSRRTLGWTVAALVLMLGITPLTPVLRRATLHAPPFHPDIHAGGDITLALDSSEDLDADGRWGDVRAQAERLPWDAAQQADDISARPGTVEQALTQLTVDERAELARLLESELKRSGA